MAIVSSKSSAGQRHSELVAKRFQLRKENNKISAQDEYARWTKNNRKLEALDRDIATAKNELEEHRKQVASLGRRLRTLMITMPLLVLRVWRGKHIVFELPHACMFPNVVSHVLARGWLALALIPLDYVRPQVSSSNVKLQGAVSLGIWVWALNNVITTVDFLITQGMAPKVPKPVQQPLREAEHEKH